MGKYVRGNIHGDDHGGTNCERNRQWRDDQWECEETITRVDAVKDPSLCRSPAKYVIVFESFISFQSLRKHLCHPAIPITTATTLTSTPTRRQVPEISACGAWLVSWASHLPPGPVLCCSCSCFFSVPMRLNFSSFTSKWILRFTLHFIQYTSEVISM